MFASRNRMRLTLAALLGLASLTLPATAQVAQVVSSADATRLVEHAAGQTEIPANPVRIVTLRRSACKHGPDTHRLGRSPVRHAQPIG